MAVIYNSNYTHNPNYYLTLAIERSARALFGDDNIVVADNMSLASLAASGEHDVLICIDGQRINVELMKRVRPAFKTMVFWAFEDPFMIDFNVENTGLFDYVFTNDPSCVSQYRGNGHYLPLAAGRSFHERKVKNAADLDYDIFFAGTMWPNRVQTLRRIITAFPQARLKLICPGNEYLPPLPSDLAALAIQRPISHEAFIDFANASAVTLTMFRDYASHGDTSQATAPGPRFYELALAGTAQVVEIGEQMNVDYLNEVAGTNVARTVDEVVDHIARILSNKAQRKKLAIASQKAVLDAHLYEHRLKRIQEVTGADFTRKPKSLEATPARRGRLRVLMCTHSTIHEQAWGGVEVYQQMLCSLLGRDVEFFYWLRRGTVARLTTSAGREIEHFDVAEIGWADAMCDASEEVAFSSALSQYDFDVVHFQHLGHHALSLPIIAKANGCGVVYSAHDFWLVSSQYNLLNHELRYVEDEVKSVVANDISLKAAENIEFGAAQTRRAFVSTMLKSVDVISFGTKQSRNLTHEIYPLLDSKRSEILGIPSPDTTVPVRAKPYAPLDGRPLRVAAIGNFLRTKGADTILSLIEAANEQLFEFHIFGYVHPEYEAVLRALNRPNVKFYGRYSVGDIDVLKIADVALNLSIWPETYCISLSEAWQNGLVPIVTDVGALGDRVIDGVNGFKVPINHPAMVLERLELLRSSESVRRSIMGNISRSLWTDAREHGTRLLELYRDVAPRRDMGSSNLQFDSGQLHLLPHLSWKHQAPPRHIFDPPTTRDVAIELPERVTDWFSIQGSETYIDDVCHHIFAENKDSDFIKANEFHIRGWYVVPSVTSAGSLYTVLVGEPDQPIIFVPCIRESRGDIQSLFPAAPRRSGFAGQVALRGKWCEGTFRIGLVNIVNGQGSFQLTSVQIDVDGGKIVGLTRQQPSNGQILADFKRVSEGDTLIRGVKLSDVLGDDLHPHNTGELAFFIDRANPPTTPEQTATDDDDPDCDLIVRGWAYLQGLARAGTLYVALVQEDGDAAFLFGASRVLRQDVQGVFGDAPLANGFIANIYIGRGLSLPMRGAYRMCLVNVVGDVAGLTVTGIRIEIADDKVVDSTVTDVSTELGQRCEAVLDQTLFA
ncbi:glycosyltransferase [Ameyamaea chiangmaiensis NBRC 103196]|uniref:Glycosyltransferase n=1 Tax=Ameyamaea chiangmaiensis TaxID=442969 RepID=A0A850PFA6_9PROT|nr:glycosyltransferase [Ameyamaea chiangmaiensis]MBS4075909.1 glycosyltransferase [Ameyamaea chiangmaiensis]NVN40592.1 glycosyltransferase [Ameyamaea chiangmaiensis]GBQ61764.1 glycosyltransferase [Ameyamaea chiangmaiensis NBRC 103196]